MYKQLVRAHRVTTDEEIAQQLVQLPVFIDMFATYVNPNNARYTRPCLLPYYNLLANNFRREVPNRKDDEDIHVDMASDVLRELLKPEKFGFGFEPSGGPDDPIDLTLDSTTRLSLSTFFRSF